MSCTKRASGAEKTHAGQQLHLPRGKTTGTFQVKQLGSTTTRTTFCRGARDHPARAPGGASGGTDAEDL
eukprot:4337234-Pyramimonas_sp.AAC.1